MAICRKLFLALIGVLVGFTSLSAQTGTVVGRIVDDASKQPLVGVAVTINQRGGLSDANGRFSIPGVAAGAQVVKATLIGYGDATANVNVAPGQTASVEIAMSLKAVEVAQLVVVGYGQQRAGNITGAVKQVTPAEFNTGRIVSPEQLIQSKVAGVQVVDNNEPGAYLNVRIRGATSVNASSEPLYVVDGVPIGSSGSGVGAGRNPLNMIAPEDIESMTVLKDAASAAIYGANAANGVVLITTKKGRKTGLEYNGSVSGSTITRRPDMLNAQQFRDAVIAHASQNANQLGNANTDWFNLVTRNGFGQEHNVAFSSIGDANSYRLSLGYLNQQGIIDATSTERLSASFNFDQRLFDDHFNLRTSLKGARNYDTWTPGGVLSNAAQMGGTQPVMDATSKTGYYNWGGGLTSPDNPLEILALASDRGTTYRSIGNAVAEYRLPFFESFKANLNLGYDLTRAERITFTPSTLHSQVKAAGGGTAYRKNSNLLNTVLEAYGNYTPKFEMIPGNIDLTGGYSYSYSDGDYPWVQASKLATNVLGENAFAGAQQLQYNPDVQQSKLISFFGRANYNLKDRYLLSASVRRDGSSRFGPNNAWGVFPAASVAWRISQEDFLKSNTSISDLKLRASWGKTGNQSFANYQQVPVYQLGDGQTQVQFGNEWVTTIRPSAYDPNLKWEETDAIDVGADFGFANNRFTGAIDYYKKNTNDLIFNVPVAAGSNLSNYVTTNVGSMRNNGVELSLSAKLLNNRDSKFNWTADFNAAHNTNELTNINPHASGAQQILVGDVAGGVGTKIEVLTPGKPINSFFVYEHKRGSDGKPLYTDNNGLKDDKFTNQPDGKIDENDLYVDQNGDGKINGDDRRPFHDPAPKWILGHSSYMTYGKFDASYTMRAYLGNYTYNNVASNLGTWQEVARGSPYNLHASVLETNFATPQYMSDYYVEDASFLRMDNISVGYSLTYRGQPVRVFASLQNAFTITGYSGVDPTSGLNGIDNNIYPRSRTFSGGLNVRF